MGSGDRGAVGEGIGETVGGMGNRVWGGRPAERGGVRGGQIGSRAGSDLRSEIYPAPAPLHPHALMRLLTNLACMLLPGAREVSQWEAATSARIA